MKKAVVLLIMSLFLLGVCEASENILERARERYLKFRKIATDITIVQTITMGGETEIEKIYRKGELFRREIGKPGDVLIINIHDGENFWVVVPERGIRQNLFPYDGRRKVLLDDWFNFFDGMELKLDRVERLGRRDCYVLAGRDDLFLWIDRKTLALIKFEGEGGDEEDEKGKFTITFSNFRTIEGWEIPLTARFYEDGKLVRSFELSLDVETVLPMELFCAESIEIEDPLLYEPPPPPPN